MMLFRMTPGVTVRASLALLAAVVVVGAATVSRAGTAFAQSASANQPVKAGSLVIEAPWTRATPGGAKVAAGYLKITNNGSEPDRLIGGTLSIATAVEAHEMAMTDGVMRMRKLEGGLEIKPGQTVELKPGGYHLMFTGLREAVKQGPPIKATLNFEKAGSVNVEFKVLPIGAMGSSSHDHHNMKH
jgi:copper(I)-binding protein